MTHCKCPCRHNHCWMARWYQECYKRIMTIPWTMWFTHCRGWRSNHCSPEEGNFNFSNFSFIHFVSCVCVYVSYIWFNISFSYSKFSCSWILQIELCNGSSLVCHYSHPSSLIIGFFPQVDWLSIWVSYKDKFIWFMFWPFKHQGSAASFTVVPAIVFHTLQEVWNVLAITR